MLRRWTVCVVGGSVALLAVGLVVGAEVKQVPVARLHSELVIAAPPAAIWKQMTTGQNLVTLCPMWKSAANARIIIRKVGDVLDFTDQWGGGGRSIVTYLSANREIRVAHEPTDGSYMCQAKLLLEPSGRGTRVQYYEQYTDEGGPQDFEATAHRVQTEMDGTLQALKKSVEKRP